jgi:hypothetical protein
MRGADTPDENSTMAREVPMTVAITQGGGVAIGLDLHPARLLSRRVADLSVQQTILGRDVYPSEVRLISGRVASPRMLERRGAL